MNLINHDSKANPVVIQHYSYRRQASLQTYELLVECQEREGLWLEGTRTVVEAASHYPDCFPALALSWARLKREACSKGKDMFKTL